MQRVANNTISRFFLNDVNNAHNAMTQLQRQLSSGKKIQTASDDPFGTAQLLTVDHEQGELATIKKNASETSNYLLAVDGSLDSAGQMLRRVRDLVVQGSSTNNDQNARNAIAAEITQLKQQIQAVANTKYGDSYVFSGTQTSTQPFAGNAYGGDTQAIDKQVTQGAPIPISLTGNNVFTTVTSSPLNTNIFDMLDNIVNDLTVNGPAGLETLRTFDLSDIDAHTNNILANRANLGALMNRLESSQDRVSVVQENLTKLQSEIGDVDFAKAMVEFNNKNTMYQSALQVGARIQQTSLLDFLR